MTLFLLDKHSLKDFTIVIIVVLTDTIRFHEYRRDNSKAKMMILDGVKDHIITHIIEKGTKKKMCDTIFKLYQDPSNNHKMILKKKLMIAKM